MAEAQNFKNHGRVVPVYHIGVFLILMVDLIWAAYRMIRVPSGDAVVQFLLSVGLILMFFSVRVQILTVQDRVIRLEMRHRFRDLLPPDVAARAGALPIKQIVALRFASDAELPLLVGDVLSGHRAARHQAPGPRLAGGFPEGVARAAH
jgi:hypothetical protein